MNIAKDGWKIHELKTEKRQLERKFKNAARRWDICEMAAIEYRLNIVTAQLNNIHAKGSK